MLRQFSRIISSQRLNISRNLSSKSGTEYFEDSLLPKVSKEGIPMRDPRDINDPDYDKPVGNVESENFTFDAEEGIGQTIDEERSHFEEYVSKFGEARFSDFAPKVEQNREFAVSTEEWKFVERLLPLTMIPAIPKLDRYPSGFQPPKISPDEAIEKYQYFVSRTNSHFLPVYLKTISNDGHEELHTDIRKAEGNLFQLKKDLDEFLFARYKQEFISQVSELQQLIKYKGDFEEEFKEFLYSKGF